MTVEEVLALVKEVADQDYDPEVAHMTEDALFVSVLEAIAQGAPNAVELASAALQANLLDYTRWYA